jgi:phosphatidylglycerophosphate synthase
MSGLRSTGATGHARSMFRYISIALAITRLLAGVLFPFVDGSIRLPLLMYAGISGLVDTTVTRQLGESSRFGRFMNPIADKTFVLLVAGTLFLDGSVAWWEFLILTSRDLVVIAISVAVMFRHLQEPMETSPLLIGKIATASQYIFLLTIIVVPVAHWLAFMLAAATSLLAAIAYVQDAVAQIHDLSPTDLSFVEREDRAFAAAHMMDPSNH